MKNKNVYIMKQPDLGKRILELRKSKGLTQEELVEKCNINVRTIQRIEAGDVTPRSFTIKTILEVLDVESETFFGSEEEEKFSEKDISILRTSWIAGIFFAIFTAISMVAEFSFLGNYEHSFEEISYRVVLGALSLVAFFFFLRGYKTLGEQFENKTLVYASYIYFALEFVMILITIILRIYDFDESLVEIISGISLILLLGVGELLIGLGIQKLKGKLGSFAQTIGIFKIIYGAMLITVILSPIAIFLAVPVLIMEIVFLYQTTQKLSK